MLELHHSAGKMCLIHVLSIDGLSDEAMKPILTKCFVYHKYMYLYVI